MRDISKLQSDQIETQRPINFVKWYVKEVLDFLKNSEIMKSNKKKSFRRIMNDLYKLTIRDNMNDPLYFFSRRQKTRV